MANFFTRALDKVTPWRRGGEVQRDQEADARRRRKEEEERLRQERQAANPPKVQAPTRPGFSSDLKPNQPVNVFETMGLTDFSNPNRVPVFKNADVQAVQQPRPGTVVEPEQPETPEDRAKRILDSELGAGKSWEDIARDNNFDLEGVKEYSRATRPNYGITVAKPKQGFWNKVRDQFDTNTEADQYRRQEGNYKAIAAGKPDEEKPLIMEKSGNIASRTPIVGHVTKMLNTGQAQLSQLSTMANAKFADDEFNEANAEWDKARNSGDQAWQIRALDRVNKAKERVDYFRTEGDEDYGRFRKNDGGLFNAGTLYDEEGSRSGDIETGLKDIALPTAVTMLDLYTLGQGAAIEQGIKTGGVRAIPTMLPTIGKAAAGNYASGDLDARAQGATGWDPVKAGLLNTAFGTVGDVALPAASSGFMNRILPKFLKGRNVSPKVLAEELDDVGITASAEAAIEATKPKSISVRKNIPIDEVVGDNLDIPVQVTPKEKGAIIREIGGDAAEATPAPKIAENVVQVRRAAADEAAANIPAGRPDPRIEGVTPTDTGNTGLFTKAEIDAERVALDDALVNKEITKTAHKAANKELDELKAVDEIPEGQKIEVKEVSGIPVTDQTVVPTNLPETPGRVRVTEATAPNNVKSAAIAAQPTVALPREVQEILDNPKQFNKRQVAAARNQRKLARAMAKTQEDTAEAMGRIEASKTNPGAGQPEGFAPTGRFTTGKRGNVSEVATRATEAAAGAREMADRSVDDLLDEVSVKETLSPGDKRRISAAKENLMKADPEGFRSSEKYKLLDTLEKAGRSDAGRALALIPRTIRKTADADALTGRWERKIGNVLDDPSRLTDAQWKEVRAANDNFTTARDTAGQLEEQFRRTGSEADFNAWEKAFQAARNADIDAKMTEVKVAQQALKGTKGASVTKTIDALKKEAEVNTMDLVTANMLSGTGTGVRNTIGTELAGIENRVGANIRAKVVKGIFGENVGGFERKGARYGRKVGVTKWMGDAGRRAANGGKNPLEWAKNWSTTINSAGESSMQSQVYSRLAKYYKNQFADAGISGKDLDLRMRHAMLTDPDEMADVYLDATMKSSGLTGMFEKGQTIEKAVADYIGGKADSKLAQGATKVAMRMLVGFPTATGNFLWQSGKRLALGVPSYIEAGFKAAKGDKRAAALAFERGLKETGSGGAVLGLGVMLGKTGNISGPYPDDPDERARWEREGISENSIKIGGAWYPIPQSAGMFGLPLLTGASIARGDIDEMYSPKNLTKLLPTDQIQGTLNALSGDGSPQAVKNMFASSVRAVTPVGALLNQISKSFDETKNDTTTKDFWSNVLDQVYSGIPGLNNAMDIPDKLDDDGNPITNPNPVELAFGATSDVQEGGVERSAEIDNKINSALSKIDQYGLLDDPNMEGVLEGSALDAYKKVKAGRQLDESDTKALKEGLVKGVSSEGTDTAYLEREQYDTNLAALKMKRDLMNEDKTTKPSSLKDIDTAIKRGEIYKEKKIPYDLIANYQSVGVEEWRKMGVGPEDEDYDPDVYDPEMYQKLYEIDQLLTNAGVSYAKGKLDKAKYTVKDAGGGGKGGSKRQVDTSFGTLKDGNYAPRVQQYAGIDSKAGNVPIIRTVRPNIVHNISSSR